MKNEDEISLDFFHPRRCESFEDPESDCNCGFDKSVEIYREQICRWVYNYYQTLKQEGMTEKQFIKKFGDYLYKISG